MDRKQLKQYLEAQIDEILKYKWIESERRHYDIGFEQAAYEWIQSHADEFRRYWFSRDLEPVTK